VVSPLVCQAEDRRQRACFCVKPPHEALANVNRPVDGAVEVVVLCTPPAAVAVAAGLAAALAVRDEVAATFSKGSTVGSFTENPSRAARRSTGTFHFGAGAKAALPDLGAT
jgi:hypothetical protein